jgi:hypothetical protein
MPFDPFSLSAISIVGALIGFGFRAGDYACIAVVQIAELVVACINTTVTSWFASLDFERMFAIAIAPALTREVEAKPELDLEYEHGFADPEHND